MCYFPHQPPPSNQTLAQVPLPPWPCLASSSFLAEGCICSLCTATNVLIPLGGRIRAGLWGLHLQTTKLHVFSTRFFPLRARQPAKPSEPFLSCAQERQMAPANHWLSLSTRQMDAMRLAHESSHAAKATADLGLDFCSSAREIPPTCLVGLIWHYLLVKTLVLRGLGRRKRWEVAQSP